MDLLAKFRRPAPLGGKLLTRERLFSKLDSSRPAVWISGPPGAGKTVLVQSWLDSRKPPCLWYRVDEDDIDPARLPQGLSGAVTQEFRRSPSDKLFDLPPLTPDRRGRIEAFGIDYFSRLFDAIFATTGHAASRAKGTKQPVQPAVLVFDDVHHALGSVELAHLLAAAVECADPAKVHLVFIARGDPPAAFARSHAHERLFTISSDELRTTDDEAKLLLDLRSDGSGVDPAEASRINAWCEGLIVGLVSVGSAPARPMSAVARDKLFRYVEAAVFESQPQGAPDLLLAYALMPSFTAAMAQAVSGDDGAGERLHTLAQANLFVSARGCDGTSSNQPPAYEFHSLLREALLARGLAVWSPAKRRAMLVCAAEQLARDRQVEAAAKLFVEAQAWAGLVALIQAYAASLLEAGRHQTLMPWLKSLPGQILDADPWLQFWSGQCAAPFDGLMACQSFTRAFEGFADRDELDGQVLSSCSAIETITLDWRDFSALDAWIERLDRLLAANPFEKVPLALAQRLASAMLSALIWRQSARPDLALWHLRSRDALLAMTDEGLRVVAGMPVLLYQALHLGNHREVDRTHELLRPSERLDQLSPADAMVACVVDALYLLVRGRCDAAIESVRRGRELRDRYGLALPGWLLTSQEVSALATSGRLAEASSALERARAHEIDRSRLLDVDIAEYAAALITLQSGEFNEALTILKATDAVTERISGPLHWSHSAFAEAQILHELGETEQARCCVERGLQLQSGANHRMFEFQALAALALFDIDRGLDATDHLRAAFDIGARNDILNYLWFRPDMFAKLCARALELGIEPKYVVRMIERRQLQAPYALEAWPWAVKLYCASTREAQMWVRGQPYKNEGNRGDAPLRLLVGIANAARDVEARRVNGCPLPLRFVNKIVLGRQLRARDPGCTIDDWIHQNIKRLRQRIGIKDVVVSVNGELAINSAVAWVDLLDSKR